MQDVGASHGVFMPILKEQKFACKSAGAKGIYRVVYSIDKYSLLLIDIYHKGSQENPDVELIKRNMKGIRESKIMVEGWYEIRAGSCRNLYLNDDHDDG
jgi:hypothetical protein